MSTVSVVIPTYERPEFLHGAIETAFNQTYSDTEIIVVDDGSTNPYAERIVSEYPKKVRCVTHHENRGLSGARNTGIEESNGKFIAFLDDDDRWHETKLARQVAAIERDEGAGLATCLVVAISPENEIIHCETSAPKGDCSDELLVGNRIGTPSRVLVRRECLNDVGGFDESLPTKQDWDFYLRACQDWRVVAVEDHLCFRTIHDSMSSSPRAAERDKQTILEKHKELIRNHGFWNQAQAEVSEIVGGAYLKTGNLGKARSHLKKSFSLIPTKQRGILLLLSYTHPEVIGYSVGIKRTLLRRLSGCSNLEMTPEQIPGLES